MDQFEQVVIAKDRQRMARMTTQFERDEETEHERWIKREEGSDGEKGVLLGGSPDQVGSYGLERLLAEIVGLEGQRTEVERSISQLDKELSIIEEKRNALKSKFAHVVELRAEWLQSLRKEYPWFGVYPKDSGDDVK